MIGERVHLDSRREDHAMRQPWCGGFACLVAVAVQGSAAAKPPDKQPAPARPRAEALEPPVERPADDGADRGKAANVAYLGIATGPVSDELRAHADLPKRGGLVITKVAPGSPAEKGGLEPHDILLEFSGRDVASPLELMEMVEAAGPGTRVKLGILRRGRREERVAVLEERAAAAGIDGRAAVEAPAGLFPGLGLPADAEAQIGAAIAQGLARGMAQAQAGGIGIDVDIAGSSVQVSTSVVNGVVQGTMVSTDDEGTVEIRVRGDRKTVAIHGADGREVHAGPLEKEADFAAIPEAWRAKVRRLDHRVSGGGRPAGRRAPGGRN
jgi:hypothetical protein